MVLGLIALGGALWLAGCGGSTSGGTVESCSEARTGQSSQRVTSISVSGIGKVAIRLTTPASPRYAAGAPLVVDVSTFFTAVEGFYNDLPADALGAVQISYLWPGKTDAATGARSDGSFSAGGPDDIRALAEVIRFATGETRDVQGCAVTDLFSFTALPGNVGLYAFSHPGIAAVNVMADHGERMPKLKYFVARENPTVAALSAMELGHWAGATAGQGPVYNATGYSFPADFADQGLNVHYTGIGWTATTDRDCTSRGYTSVPSFGNGAYVLGCKIPQMGGKRYYSTELLEALASGPLSHGAWPPDLATVAEAQAAWPYRSTSPARYQSISKKLPSLKVMLVFNQADHVQVLADKPHVHAAWDGFRAGSLWVRLNPDRAYVGWISGTAATEFPDTDANVKGLDWSDAGKFAAPNSPGSTTFVPAAAVAEMMDRVQAGNWSTNLDATLFNTPRPTLQR